MSNSLGILSELRLLSTYISTIMALIPYVLVSLSLPVLFWGLLSKHRSDVTGSNSKKRVWKDRLEAVILVALLYLGVWWFQDNNVWNTSLNQTGAFFVKAGLIRLAITSILLWTTFGIGFAALDYFSRRWSTGQPLLFIDRWIIAFLIGAAITRVVMLAFGYLNLYYVWLVAALVAVAILGSYGSMKVELDRLIQTLSQRLHMMHFGRKIIGGLLVAMLVFSLLMLFITQALYPNAYNGDYLTHYGPYYAEVLRSHGLAPNEIWYQFFYSKGAGESFIGMLLTDPLGKHAVAYMFFLILVLILISVLLKLTNSSRWATVGAIVLTCIFIKDDSGGFEKHHVVNAVLISGLYLVAILATDRDGKSWNFWALIGGAVILSQIILSPPSAIYSLILIGSYSLFAVVTKKWHLLAACLSWSVVATVAIVAIAISNYVLTGFPELTPFRVGLHFWNQEISKFWISPYLMIYLMQGTDPGLGTVGFLNAGVIETISKLVNVTRLDRISQIMFGNFVVLAILLVLLFISVGVKRKIDRAAWRILIPTLLIVSTVCFSYLTVNQPVSVYRATAFVVFFVVICTVAVWANVFSLWSENGGAIVRVVAPLMTLVLATFAILFSLKINPNAFDARLRLMAGKIGLAEAYRREYGVDPELYLMRATRVPPEARVVALNLGKQVGLEHFIGRGIETEVSYSFGPDWHTLAFSGAEKSKTAFRNIGINYFLINTSAPAFGAFPFSELFDPQTLNQHFKVVWENGTFFLLTWNNDAAEGGAVTDFHVSGWQNALRLSEGGADLFSRTRHIFKLNQGKLSDIYIPADLPPVSGWQ